MAITSIPNGSVTLFNQSFAPVKWTKNVLYNDYALRVTSGTVGVSGPLSTVPFSTLNTTNVEIGGSYTITGASVTGRAAGAVGPHTHQMGPLAFVGPFDVFYNQKGPNLGGAGTGPAGTAGFSSYTGYAGVSTSATGGGGSHSHTASSPYSTFPFGPFGITTNFSFNVRYLDVILCTRTG